ncbi:MAG: hypothetical protein U5L07_01180 [Desulfobacterales bacterium]|nr:hypothetical protein [Desulfobacterales bacterium]
MQTESATAASADSSARYVLAFDLGSSSIKAAIVSDGGAVLFCAAEPVVTQIHPHGGAEQDSEA